MITAPVHCSVYFSICSGPWPGCYPCLLNMKYYHSNFWFFLSYFICLNILESMSFIASLYFFLDSLMLIIYCFSHCAVRCITNRSKTCLNPRAHWLWERIHRKEQLFRGWASIRWVTVTVPFTTALLLIHHCCAVGCISVIINTLLDICWWWMWWQWNLFIDF